MRLTDARGRHRVVVTGTGAITCIGNDADSTWNSLVAGRSGVRRINVFGEMDYPIKVAGQITGFDAETLLGKLVAGRNARFVNLGLAAALQALADAGFRRHDSTLRPAAVSMGNGHGDWCLAEWVFPVVWRNDGTLMHPPDTMDKARYDAISSTIGAHIGAAGPRATISTACASGGKAIEQAFRWLSRGVVPVAVAGGAEAIVDHYCIRFLHAMRALSTHNADPHNASRPFDRDRTGFVIGEGAGMLVLETLEHALARKAPIHAELIGVGGSSNATSLYTPDPEGDGSAVAMNAAIRSAGINPSQVDTIFAHATATDTGDPAEANSIRSVFGPHAPEIAITAPKSMMGHPIGASAAIAAVMSVHAIIHNTIPPVLNLENPDPCIDGLHVVRGRAEPRRVDCVLSNAFGFGGVNASTIFRRFAN